MSDEGWVPATTEPEVNEQYEAISAEVRRLSDDLRDADEAAVAAEQARLRPLAEQITDGLWRQRALKRIEKLPLLAKGPQPGESPQYAEALTLVSRAHGLRGPIPERIAETERISWKIHELAQQAPIDDRGTIMRMNNSLARIIEDLQEGRL